GARRVDDDPGHTPLLEEAKQLRAYVLRVPRLMARFEQEHVVADLVARPLEVVERRGLPDDVRRHLEQDAAELPRRAQRLERGEEHLEDASPQLARRP